jgi:hypothetical protein
VLVNLEVDRVTVDPSRSASLISRGPSAKEEMVPSRTSIGLPRQRLENRSVDEQTSAAGRRQMIVAWRAIASPSQYLDFERGDLDSTGATARAIVSTAESHTAPRRWRYRTLIAVVSTLPNGPAFSCRPPVSVPGSDRRTPGEPTPGPGGRPAGKPGRPSGGGRSAAMPC